LKPFYRPHEKKGKKRPEPTFVQVPLNIVPVAVELPTFSLPNVWVEGRVSVYEILHFLSKLLHHSGRDLLTFFFNLVT
jgi:hypothetical protein